MTDENHINLLTWETWRKRHEPIKRCRQSDGVIGIWYSMAPTILALGFQLLASEYNYSITAERKPREIAIDIINRSNIDTSDKEFIYTLHRGSQINCMMDTLTVYFKDQMVEVIQ